MATPGFAVRSSISSSRNRGAPSSCATVSGAIVDRRFVAFGAAAGDLAAQRPDLTLEIADAGLAGVAADHRADGLLVKVELLARQTVVLDLLVDQVLARRS